MSLYVNRFSWCFYFSVRQLTFLHLIGCGLWFISDSTIIFSFEEAEEKKIIQISFFDAKQAYHTQTERKIYVIKCFVSVALLSLRQWNSSVRAKEMDREKERRRKKEWDIQINYNLNQSAFLYLLWISKMLIILVASLVSRTRSFSLSLSLASKLSFVAIALREFRVQFFSHTTRNRWPSTRDGCELGMGLFWRKLFDYSCLHFVFFSLF